MLSTGFGCLSTGCHICVDESIDEISKNQTLLLCCPFVKFYSNQLLQLISTDARRVFHNDSKHLLYTVVFLFLQVKPPTNLVLQDTVDPHNEYFSSQFLVAFNSTGNHELTVITSVRDEDGGLWETGPQAIVHADVIEHGAIRRSGTKT